MILNNNKKKNVKKKSLLSSSYVRAIRIKVDVHTTYPAPRTYDGKDETTKNELGLLKISNVCLITTVAYSMYLFISTYHFFCSSIKIFKWFNFVWFSKVITQGQHFKYCKIRMTMVPNIFNIPSPTHDRKK